MTGLRTTARNIGDSLDQPLHRLECLVVGKNACGKRPDIAERHRAETGSALAGPRFDRAMDVYEGNAVKRNAAELDRRAVAEVLEIARNLSNADIRGAVETCRVHATILQSKHEYRNPKSETNSNDK